MVDFYRKLTKGKIPFESFRDFYKKNGKIGGTYIETGHRVWIRR